MGNRHTAQRHMGHDHINEMQLGGEGDVADQQIDPNPTEMRRVNNNSDNATHHQAEGDDTAERGKSEDETVPRRTKNYNTVRRRIKREDSSARRKSSRLSVAVDETPGPSSPPKKSGRDSVDADGVILRNIRRKQKNSERLTEGERLILEEHNKSEEWRKFERNKTLHLNGQTLEAVLGNAKDRVKLPKGWAFNVPEEEMREAKRLKMLQSQEEQKSSGQLGLEASDEEEEEEEEEAKAAVGKLARIAAPTAPRRKHRYLDHGLYVGQQRSSNPTSKPKQNAKPPSQQNPNERRENPFMPMPMYTGEALIERSRDFKLPFNIYGPSPSSKTKPDSYQKRSRNRFVGDAALYWADERPSDQSLCLCTPEDGCGASCLNREMEYECDDSLCNVGEEYCTNRQFTELRRRVEKGSRFEIGVEVTDYGSKGFGLRACRSFNKDQIVIEYSGEIITRDESNRRTVTEYESAKNFYLMELDANLIIDATRGSDARFVNHSCTPNCEMRKFTVNGKPRMALFALRYVETGEELTYDYNYQSNGEAQLCLCGSSQCRGVIGPRGRDRDRPITSTKPARVSGGKDTKKLNTAPRHAAPPKKVSSATRAAPGLSIVKDSASDDDDDVFTSARVRRRVSKPHLVSRGPGRRKTTSNAKRAFPKHDIVRAVVTDDETPALKKAKTSVNKTPTTSPRTSFRKSTSIFKKAIYKADTDPNAVIEDEEPVRATSTRRMKETDVFHAVPTPKKSTRGVKRSRQEFAADADLDSGDGKPARKQSGRRSAQKNTAKRHKPDVKISAVEDVSAQPINSATGTSISKATPKTVLNFPYTWRGPTTEMGRIFAGLGRTPYNNTINSFPSSAPSKTIIPSSTTGSFGTDNANRSSSIFSNNDANSATTVSSTVPNSANHKTAFATSAAVKPSTADAKKITNFFSYATIRTPTTAANTALPRSAPHKFKGSMVADASTASLKSHHHGRGRSVSPVDIGLPDPWAAFKSTEKPATKPATPRSVPQPARSEATKRAEVGSRTPRKIEHIHVASRTSFRNARADKASRTPYNSNRVREPSPAKSTITLPQPSPRRARKTFASVAEARAMERR